MREERKIVFWTCQEGAEELSHSEIEDAVADWAGNFADLDRVLPATVKVYGYARMIVTVLSAPAPDYVLELVLEALDEEHGSEDGTDPTPSMKAAAEAFLAAVVAEYVPFSCDLLEEKVVTVADYYPPAGAASGGA